MTNKHLALQIRNSLQRYGVQADADALFDVIYETIEENSEDTKPTIRDQFAMHILPSLMLRWKELGYTESGAVAEAYHIANSMMECSIMPINVCQCDSDEQCKAKIEIDRLTVQLADRDTELKRQTEIVEDAEQSYFRIVDKYNSRADQILQLQTENAALREDVERLREANHQLASAAICPDHLRPENVRKQAAQECLEILNRCTLHNDMSFAYAQIIHTFGLEG